MKQEDIELPCALHGSAINTVIYTENGEIWISNGEYASQVNYCPISGKKADIQITAKILEEENTDNFYKSLGDECTSEYFAEIKKISDEYRKIKDNF